MFKGYFTALMTPFADDGSVDEAAFQNFVQFQIDQGIHGVVPCGTTGESPTLSFAEHKRIVDMAVEVAKGKVPVLAGSGSNSTAHAIELAQYAKEAGADAAMVVVPYYNKPTQEGMYQHFKAVHDAVDIPIVMYNVPGRAVVNMSLETQERLSKLPRIVGIKDATGDLERPIATDTSCDSDFIQMCGEDHVITPFLAQGGHGAISITSNIAPKLCSDLFTAWEQEDLATVDKLNEQLMPVHKAMFFENNPMCVKYAGSLLGLCSAKVRLPLCDLSDEGKEVVEAALKKADLL